MIVHAFTSSEPRALLREPSHDGDLWAIVLAGGEGSRLRALTRRAFGPVARARLSFKLIVFETLLIAVVVGAAFLALSMEIRATTQRFFVTE